MRRALAFSLALAAVPAGAVEEPAGYRMSAYRAPVPASLAGAAVVTTDQAHAIWQAGGAAFIDVLPQQPRPDNLPEGTVWRDKPRASIPGAIWLPNTGYGAVADETMAYFLSGLDAATGGDRDHPLVFFCLPDCWMSWNAAKRALEQGFTDVIWYPLGSAGWEASGHALEDAVPYAR